MSFPCVEQAALADLACLEGMLLRCREKQTGKSVHRSKTTEGIRFLLENPSHGRICVIRKEGSVLAMAGLVTTISTAEGGFVLWLEDLVVDPAHRCDGCEEMLLNYAISYAKENGFLRITVLLEQTTPEMNCFLRDHGFEESGMIPMRFSVGV